MARFCLGLTELQKYIIWIIALLTFFRDVHAFVNVRLENGAGEYEGSVEIMVDGYNWEIVCGSSEFDILDVIVICRQLGYPGANRALVRSQYPAGNYPMSSIAFRCTGTEYHLNNCGFTETYCASRQYAGAVCYTQDSGYLGCFNDKFNAPALAEVAVEDDGMTISRCVNFCQSNRFAYAGLKLSTKCVCGSENAPYNKYGRISDAQCHYPCGGAEYESCGGYLTMSVFRVVNDVGPTTSVTTRPRTTRQTPYQTITGGSRYNSTQPEVSKGYLSTPAVTVRMVAKEGNFINQPSGIAVVISLSVGTLILILIVVFLVRRRSSIPDSKRKPSTRPYEEITLDIKEEEDPGTAPNEYCETGDVPPDTPLVVTPRDHTYERAELFSPGERTSEMYCTVPDVQLDNPSAPTSQSKPETPPAIRDLYAKPLKKTLNVARNDTSYETINDEDLRIDPKCYLGGDRDRPNGHDACTQPNSHDGYSTIQNGGDDDAGMDLDAMYAKPLKKGHRKVVKEDSFDESCMVENELYTSTDS